MKPMPDTPCDCQNNPLRVGMVVYTPDGWNSTQPRPWKAATIRNVLFIDGKYYLDFEGAAFMRCPAHSVSTIRRPNRGQPRETHACIA